MESPVCGRKIPDEYVEYLDNGNLACPKCVNAERNELEKEEKKDEN